MSTLYNTVLTDVLQRIRDNNDGNIGTAAKGMSTATPPTTADGQTNVLTLMQHAEYFINIAERLVQASVGLQLSNNTVLYSISSSLPNALGPITFVLDNNNVNIDGPVPYNSLGHADRKWLSTTGTALLSYGTIGLDLMALYPAFSANAPIVTIGYIQKTGPAVLGGSITITDDTAIHLSRLTELLCRIKTRQLGDFQNRLMRLAQDIQMSDALSETGGKAD